MSGQAVTRCGALLVSALLLAGCGGYISQLPIIGSENVPPPPAERPPTPTIRPSAGPEVKAMTAAERLKLEGELAAARTGSVQQRRQLIAQPDPSQ